MSRSKKWRLEWAFFLGENGRRQYNHICKKCVHGCKQSFRACLMAGRISALDEKLAALGQTQEDYLPSVSYTHLDVYKRQMERKVTAYEGTESDR